MKTTLLLAAFTAIFIYSCTTIHPIIPNDLAVNSSAENIANGKRMTAVTCGPCHFNSSTKAYTGSVMHDAPKVLGRIVSRNLTHDKQYGIGDYTEGQLSTLIRTGVAKDGRYLPFMFRPNISDQDLNDIIAFLKSDDAEVKANPANEGKSKYSPIGKMAMKGKPAPLPKNKIEKPSEDKKVELGKYLVDNLACYHCHSKTFMKLDANNPEKSKGFMGGGNPMRSMDGSTILSSNISPDETGIKNYTLAEFSRAIKEGISKKNQPLRFPMPNYASLTEGETAALFEYLRSIPAIKNEVKRK